MLVEGLLCKTLTIVLGWCTLLLPFASSFGLRMKIILSSLYLWCMMGILISNADSVGIHWICAIYRLFTFPSLWSCLYLSNASWVLAKYKNPEVSLSNLLSKPNSLSLPKTVNWCWIKDWVSGHVLKSGRSM